MDLVKEIEKLKKDKKAIILAHYYVRPELQDVADYVGDSLGLSQKAAETDAEIIVFVGVNFMAETAKILSPGKKVLLPDLEAGCSLADSIPAADFSEFIRQHPDHIVITYVNTTAEIKSMSDICCTSSNAKQIVESLPKDQKIIFAPDKNLGNYINSVTDRDMVLWDGQCHVHHEFSIEGILALKSKHPGAKVIAHPECQKPILLVADHIGSTSELLTYSHNDACKEFIVVTESGILHKMKQKSPDKSFYPAPSDDPNCVCADCNFMKLNTLEKLYQCLKNESPEISIDPEMGKKALIPIRRMLEISEKLGI
ncbi:MAG: quinolinate synthase NadA [Bacteroidales bacterium]|nr:quinolinate synthase NadA [Bacteroidales bacterium]